MWKIFYLEWEIWHHSWFFNVLGGPAFYPSRARYGLNVLRDCVAISERKCVAVEVHLLDPRHYKHSIDLYYSSIWIIRRSWYELVFFKVIIFNKIVYNFRGL
jgi:hypothetical protein